MKYLPFFGGRSIRGSIGAYFSGFLFSRVRGGSYSSMYLLSGFLGAGASST